MRPDRRYLLCVGASTVALSGLGIVPALARVVEDAVFDITQGAEIKQGGIIMDLPASADDGYAVAVAVEAPQAIDISIIAEANPDPHVVSFHFGRLSGTQRVRTRIRLATSQSVVALARMQDGTFRMASQPIDVLVGGCGV